MTKPPTACRYLNNKAFALPLPMEEEGEPRPFATPFWCLETHDAVGPDGGEVSDRSCGPDRPCFRPEVEL
jgi:hypothetical protein